MLGKVRETAELGRAYRNSLVCASCATHPNALFDEFCFVLMGLSLPLLNPNSRSSRRLMVVFLDEIICYTIPSLCQFNVEVLANVAIRVGE